MKILEISNNEGKFLDSDNKYKNINQISKEDIYRLLNIAFDEDSVEMDLIGEDKEIKNPANKIIYENIYAKITQFIGEKSRIADEISSVFSEFNKIYADEIRDRN